jgi:hypothetical protein
MSALGGIYVIQYYRKNVIQSKCNLSYYFVSLGAERKLTSGVLRIMLAAKVLQGSSTSVSIIIEIRR